MDGRLTKTDVIASTNKVFMDIVDVRDELINLKNYYEYATKKFKEAGEDVKSYKASYSAVALSEAAKLIERSMKNKDRLIDFGGNNGTKEK